jgi:hypothetical protein
MNWLCTFDRLEPAAALSKFLALYFLSSSTVGKKVDSIDAAIHNHSRHAHTHRHANIV